MVMFIVDWATFKKLSTGQGVYFIEDAKTWDFYAMGEHTELLRCTIAKSQGAEANLMFVEKEINSRPNVIKVVAVDLGGTKLTVKPKIDLPDLNIEKQNSEQVMEILPDTRKVDRNVVKEAMNAVEEEQAGKGALSKEMLGDSNGR